MVSQGAKMTKYGQKIIDLTTARADVEIKLSGKRISIISSTATAAVYLQLDTRDAVKLDLRQYRTIQASFERLYLTHAAQAGKSISLIIGDIDLFKAEPMRNLSIENTVGVAINPATEDKQDDVITALGLQSTEAKQDDTITALGTLETSVTAMETKQDDAITALALLETGKSTAALQTTGNTALGTLETSLTAMEAKQDDAITALALLETGKSTAALQTTGNTALDTLEASLTAIETKQDDAITALALLETGKSTAALQTTGNTALDTLEASLTAMETKQDIIITELEAVAPQAHGIDAVGTNAYATVVTASGARRHMHVSLQGSYDAIVSIDSGTTENFYIPANSSCVFDCILIADAATIQGKNAGTDENYEKLSITVW